MLFALFDVGVEIGEPPDTHWFKASDVAQALDVSRRQPDMYTKLQHVFLITALIGCFICHGSGSVYVSLAQDRHPSSRFQVASTCTSGFVEVWCRVSAPAAHDESISLSMEDIMKHHNSPWARSGTPRANSVGKVDPLIEQLEALPSGTRVVTRDGAQFIRTNRMCICFCDLTTGHLCSAKDLCYVHGGSTGGEAGHLH